MSDESTLNPTPNRGYNEQTPDTVPKYPHLSEPQETPAQHRVEQAMGAEIRPMPRVPNPYAKFGRMARMVVPIIIKVPTRAVPRAMRMDTNPPPIVRTKRNPLDMRPSNRHCDPFAGLDNPCGIRRPMPKGMKMFPARKRRGWF